MKTLGINAQLAAASHPDIRHLIKKRPKTLHQAVGKLPLDPDLLAETVDHFVYERRSPFRFVDVLTRNSAMLDIGILATLGLGDVHDSQKARRWALEAFRNRRNDLLPIWPQIVVSHNQAMQGQGEHAAIGSLPRRELQIGKAALDKLGFITYRSGPYAEAYLKNPSKRPDPAALTSPIKNVVKNSAGLVIAENSLREWTDLHPEQVEAHRNVVGLLTEVDAFTALGRVISKNNLGVWLLPTGSILEHPRHGRSFDIPGLDFVMVAPHLQRVYGVQVKANVENMENRELPPGVLLIDGLTDLANYANDLPRPGTVTAAAHHHYFGEDISGLTMVNKPPIASLDDVELVDLSVFRPKLADSAHTLQQVDRQITYKMERFAPELFEVA